MENKTILLSKERIKKMLIKNKIDEIAKLQMKILNVLDYNINDSSIIETGERVGKHLVNYCKNKDQDLEDLRKKLKTFEEVGYDQIVIKKGIEVHSMCEHHMLPIVGKATICYLPKQIVEDFKPSGETTNVFKATAEITKAIKKYKIVGTSKLARIVKYFSMQFTIQERLTSQIANFIMDELDAQGVWVIINAQHFCEKIRGIRNPSDMITSTILGIFRTDAELKSETQFLLS